MLAEQLYDIVTEYVNRQSFILTLGLKRIVSVSYLAQGEYNLNYLLQSGADQYVLRINTGSQMGLDNQIAYEYKALRLLSRSKVTPRAFYLDDTKMNIPFGTLVMEYLPGEPLDYRFDLIRAARTFACIHGLEFADSETKFLVKEPGPFTGIMNEVTCLLQQYFSHPQANSQTKKLLDKIMDKAQKRKPEEKYLLVEPWLRVINTEVNSHNFIVNAKTEKCCLIDWEKPIYGEPAQDLGHFLIATTTLWKRDYILSKEEEDLFLRTYLNELPPCSQVKTLRDRVDMFKFFNLLRAVSWCAMAWTEYIKPDRPLSNQDTLMKIKMYIEPEFLTRVFKPYLQ